MAFSPEQFDLLSKKERKEIRRKQKMDAIKEFRRFRKIQKVFFWAILTIIVLGSLYILMAIIGYAQAVTLNLANLSRTLREFYDFAEEFARQNFVLQNLGGLAKKNCLLYT